MALSKCNWVHQPRITTCTPDDQLQQLTALLTVRIPTHLPLTPTGWECTSMCERYDCVEPYVSTTGVSDGLQDGELATCTAGLVKPAQAQTGNDMTVDNALSIVAAMGHCEQWTMLIAELYASSLQVCHHHRHCLQTHRQTRLLQNMAAAMPTCLHTVPGLVYAACVLS